MSAIGQQSGSNYCQNYNQAAQFNPNAYHQASWTNQATTACHSSSFSQPNWGISGWKYIYIFEPSTSNDIIHLLYYEPSGFKIYREDWSCRNQRFYSSCREIFGYSGSIDFYLSDRPAYRLILTHHPTDYKICGEDNFCFYSNSHSQSPVAYSMTNCAPLPPPKIKREIIDFHSHHSEEVYKQIFDTPSIKDYELYELKRKERILTPEHCYRFFDRHRLIDEKKDLIELHISRRVQLFFQQAILCYNTPFYYEADSALDQVGQGGSLNIPAVFYNGIALTQESTHKTQAAHSSTLPCLYAYPKDIYGNLIRDQRFVFLRYTNYYKQQNATVELPIEVNQVDSRLDGTSQQNKLRQDAIILINQVARSKMNPTDATKKFLSKLVERIAQLGNELSPEDARRDVLWIYFTHVREIGNGVVNSSQIFDQIMGVKLSPSDEVLRNVVYRKRYEVIQEAECIECEIAHRIFDAEKRIFGSIVQSFKKVDYRLRIVLLQRSSTSREKQFYEKYFCASLEQLFANLAAKQAKLRKVRDEINAFNQYQWQQIYLLGDDLSRQFSRLENLELEYRAKLFKGLRKDYAHWYQREFVEAFKAIYPNEPMSQPMVSRLEQPTRLKPGEGFYCTPENQRRKEINISKAQKIADTYGIDVGLFLACLITSQ